MVKKIGFLEVPYSEFDVDPNWNDFMLRSYDPQLGRFLQWDPYDQFSSGYVGMGADPVNMVDPTGGAAFGSGPRMGCAATQGMSGYGGMANRLVGSSFSVLNTVAAVGSKVASAARIANGLSNHSSASRQGLRSSSNSLSGLPEEDYGSSGCPDCPPGYSSTPNGPGDEPYFFDPDHAAKRWAFAMRNIAKEGPYEWSSLLFSVNIKSGKSVVTLYAMTTARRFSDTYDPRSKLKQSLSKPYNWLFSPGVGDDQLGFHKWDKLKPEGAVLRGHIHLHPARTSYGVIGGNDSFSPGDITNNNKFDTFNMYVLGALGNLYKQFPSELPYKRNSSGFISRDTDEGQVKLLESGYFNLNMKEPKDCKCYKK